MLTESPVTWEAIVAESDRRRRRRRGAATVALVVALGAGGIGVASRFGGSPSGTDIIAGPDKAAAPVDTRALVGGPVRSLARLFELPACSGDGAGLTAWTAEALAPYIALDRAALRPTAMHAVAEVVPVLRDAPPAGSCARGMAMGDARAWEVLTGDGQILGRGAGAPLTGPDFPPRLSAKRPYLQESVASGQGFSGGFDGRRLDGTSATGAVVVELAPTASTPAGANAAGLDMLGRLSFATVAPLAAVTASQLPASAPGGFTRCTGDLWHLRQRAGGPEVELCDAAGRTITITWAGAPLGPAESQFVDVNGTPGRVMALPGGRTGISLDPTTPGGRRIQAEASWRVGADQLATMLRSVPALDNRLLQPRVETGDVRYLLADADRLRPLLERAGATGVGIVPAQPCGGPGVVCPARVEITFLVPSGARATLFLFPENLFRDVAGSSTGVETVAGIDVLQHSPGVTARGPLPEDATFVCGKVTFSIRGVDTLAFAKALIPTMGC